MYERKGFPMQLTKGSQNYCDLRMRFIMSYRKFDMLLSYFRLKVYVEY